MDIDGKRVLIVGGGFGGLATALSLASYKIPNLKISLISDKNHFEYHAGLYRVVTGKSPLEVCIPISDVFKGKNIEFINDHVSSVDLGSRVALGSTGGKYNYDFLILALGSETSYFNIPGLEKYSFGFKSITEALRLKRHLHELFESCAKATTEQAEKICLLDFVVVGAGASGVELAGELAVYAKKLAKEHNVSKSLITIQLFEGADRVLPLMPEKVSEKVLARLRELGINVMLNRPMEKGEIEAVMVRGIKMKTETIIWTAGVKPNALYKDIRGLNFDSKGRILIDEYLQVKNFKNVYAVGDSAATIHSGMAQTAIYDGRVVAKNIRNKIKGRALEKYIPRRPFHSIPVGPGWAATTTGNIFLYGYLGWIFRKIADLRYFMSILPIAKAYNVFVQGRTICEACSICLPAEADSPDDLEKSKVELKAINS